MPEVPTTDVTQVVQKLIGIVFDAVSAAVVFAHGVTTLATVGGVKVVEIVNTSPVVVEDTKPSPQIKRVRPKLFRSPAGMFTCPIVAEADVPRLAPTTAKGG